MITPPNTNQPRAPMDGQQHMNGAAQNPGMAQQAPYQQGQPQQAQPAADLSWVRTGDQARVASQQAMTEQEQRRQARASEYKWPRRFFLKAPKPDGSDDHQANIIILDAEPGPCYYEHMMPDHRGWKTVPVPCVKEFDNCPLCPPHGESDSSFVMLLTLLNLKGYWSKKLNQHVHPTRELMVVKLQQHNTIFTLRDTYGTLRGLELKMVRNGPRSPRIGEPDAISFQPVLHSEQELLAYLTQHNKMGPETYQDRTGKMVEKYPAGHMMQPFNYAEFLERPTAEALRQRWGGSAPIGADGFNGQTDQGQWGASAPTQAAPPAGFGQHVAPAQQPGGGNGMGMAAPDMTTPTVASQVQQSTLTEQQTTPHAQGAHNPDPSQVPDTPTQPDAVAQSAPAPETTVQTTPPEQVPAVGVRERTPPSQHQTSANQSPTELDDEIPF